MDLKIAHDINSLPRTEDVSLLENVTFRDMFFSETIYKALTSNGFHKPSPIQFKAIPLARCGFDLIVQSKSGTGKTLVFVTTALESIDLTVKRVQVLVLAPTREIALQIKDVFKVIGSSMKDLVVGSFIGGTPLPKDIVEAQSCHVAVGAPGRLRQLVEQGHLKMEAVRLFVLDEADQLMASAFQPDINFIYWSLSEFKQTLALSATYPTELVQFLGNYTRSGKLVTPQTDTVPVLKGLKQFISLTRDHPDSLARLTDKEQKLVGLLSSVKFNQCLIFSNYQSRAESTCNMLRCRGWSCEWISGKQTQDERIRALTEVRTGRCRLLVSTDLTARGIDSKGINLVINVDTPYDPRIYLHRMGRAGRYGSHGIVITILSRGQDFDNFCKMLGLIDKSLPVKLIPSDLNVDLWSDDIEGFDEIYGLDSSPEAVELYKPHLFPNEPGESYDKKSKNNKNLIKAVAIRENGVKPPSLNDKNSAAFHEKLDDVKKNHSISLNEYFLVGNCDLENMPNFSSLQESLKEFVIDADTTDKSLLEKELDWNPTKTCTEEETGNGDLLFCKSLKKRDVKTRRLSGSKSSQSSCNDVVQQLNARNKSNSKNVLEPSARKFSYSDITKGKRVECKRVHLEPDQVTSLKKSPLKLFPGEKVTSEIEGVQISDKAINGFSKRMYSSVLKEPANKTNSSMTNGHDLLNVSNQKVRSSAKLSLNLDSNLVSRNSINSVTHNAGAGFSSSKTLEKSDLSMPDSKVSLSVGSSVRYNHQCSSIPVTIGKHVETVNDRSAPKSILPKSHIEKSSVTCRKVITNNVNIVDKPNVIGGVVDNYKKVKQSDCSQELNESAKIGTDIYEYSSNAYRPELNIYAASSPAVVPSCGNQTILSVEQTKDSGGTKSTSCKRAEVTFEDSTSTDSSLSEGEYIVSGSFFNYSSPRPRFQSASDNRSFGFDNWFRLYYQQTSVIYNYMKRATNFQNTLRLDSHS